MLGAISCPACGEKGRILTDNESDFPNCPLCGQALEAEPVYIATPACEEPTVSDIVAWLSEQDPAGGHGVGITTCSSCRIEQMALYESDRGELVCMVCLTLERGRHKASCTLVDCPDCREPLELYEVDRGKTVVCPHCHHFLGCLLHPEKRRFVALPFLNALLGVAKG